MKIGKFIVTAIDRLSTIFADIGSCMVVFAMLSVLYGVLMRALHLQASWVIEVNSYMTGAIMFLALSYVQKHRGHIKVELFFQRFPHKVKPIVEICGAIFSLLYIFSFIWRSWVMTYSSMQRGLETPGYLNFPLFIPQLIMTIGFIFVALQLVLILISDIRALLNRGNGNIGVIETQSSGSDNDEQGYITHH